MKRAIPLSYRRPRESGGPGATARRWPWVPAFAGMTAKGIDLSEFISGRALRDRESLLSADMTLETHDEIKQLFLEFQTAGVRFFQTLRKAPWGANTFIVKDPDGNLLLFAGPAN